MMHGYSPKPPIFVVGVPRSGTTLLAAMLAAHSRLSCGPETRFFHFLAKTDPEQLCQARSWPDEAVTFLFATNLVGSPVPDHYDVTKDQIQAYLRQRPAAIPVILESLTEQFMRNQGKRRWVEKSPEHLRHVHIIRQYFPHSPIIRIVRDARDVALSLLKAPWAPSDFLDALMLWGRYDEQSKLFFQNDQNSYTLFYENLVESPETELKRLCVFIDQDFEPQMLDTSRSAANVVAKKEVWHRIVDQPLNKTRLQVWKREITPEQNRLAEALIGDRLKAYGYECVESLERAAAVYPSVATLVKHRGSLASFVAEGIRFWETGDENQRPLMIYVGQPDEDQWFRPQKPERWWDAARIVTQLVKGKLARQAIYWVREQDGSKKWGFSSRLLALVFQIAAARQTA